MTADNPLIAGPVDTATPFSGAGLLDSGTQLASAIESGSWVEGGIAAFSTAVDTAAAVSDPLGSLIGAGLGFLIDHFEPLKGWFNDLTGDPGEVAAFAQTWSNIQQQLDSSGNELTRILGDIDELAGEAIDAYRRFQTDAAEHIHAAGSWAGAMSTGLSIASTIVQVVHDLVRDVISQLVGSAISWAAEFTLTLGLATPWIIEQVSTRVASLAAKVGSSLTSLLHSMKAFSKLLEKLRALLKLISDLFGKVLETAKSTARRAMSDERGMVDLEKMFGRRKVDAPDLDDVLTDVQKADIAAMPKGARPDPSTYLPADYISVHLDEFSDGATRYMTESNLNKYGIAQRDGTSYVMPKSQVNDLMNATGGDTRAMEKALGLPDGFFDDGVVRVDVKDPGGNGLRMPSGNEAGANDQWIPGGKLPTGVSEAVIDGGKIGPDGYDVSPVGPSKGP